MARSTTPSPDPSGGSLYIRASKLLVMLILAESSMELAPPEIWRHPSIARDAERRGKRPGEILLDRARHHGAMLGLKDAERRGRPDIVHMCMLAFQYSLLAAVGRGSMAVHTINDVVIRLRPDVRPPKNYNNFVGLMEQLLSLGRVPAEGEPLMRAEPKGLRPLLDEAGGAWVVLHERGVRMDPLELGRLLADSVVVVGGFPHGDFKNSWLLEEADGVYRLGDRPLDAWQVVSRAVVLAEIALGLI
jgi:rRNA small subunit pseudouridine methyltransferase Nep1